MLRPETSCYSSRGHRNKAIAGRRSSWTPPELCLSLCQWTSVAMTAVHLQRSQLMSRPRRPRVASLLPLMQFLHNWCHCEPAANLIIWNEECLEFLQNSYVLNWNSIKSRTAVQQQVLEQPCKMPFFFCSNDTNTWRCWSGLPWNGSSISNPEGRSSDEKDSKLSSVLHPPY